MSSCHSDVNLMLSTRVNIAGTNISSPTLSVTTSTDYTNAHPYVAPVVILVHVFKRPGSIPADAANNNNNNKKILNPTQ